MSSPNSSLRHRGPKDKNKANGQVAIDEKSLDAVLESTKKAVTKEWDYKLALSIITALAFATRFFGIQHPDEVVFDEVHFGKVRDMRKRRGSSLTC
jgi:dolichyl-phosphate-mannose-protein mannosyltransferase